MIGADHVARLTNTTAGAVVSAVIEPEGARAAAAAALAPGASTYRRVEDALAAGTMDAVLIATPGQFHEPVLLPVLEAGLPILCEKPLTPDPETSWQIVQAEQKGGRQLIQVGFMRRFDPEYRQLRQLIAAGSRRGPAAAALRAPQCVGAGQLHPGRCSSTTQSCTSSTLSRGWRDATIRSVEVRYARRNALEPGAPARADPRPHGAGQRGAGRRGDERQRPVRLPGRHRGRFPARRRAHRPAPGHAAVAARPVPDRGDIAASSPASGRRSTSRCSRGSTPPGGAPSTGRPPGTDTKSPSPARPACRQ